MKKRKPWKATIKECGGYFRCEISDGLEPTIPSKIWCGAIGSLTFSDRGSLRMAAKQFMEEHGILELTEIVDD